MDGLSSLWLLLVVRFLLLPVCLLLATPVVLLVACFQSGAYTANVRRNYEWVYCRVNRLIGTFGM